MAASGGINIGRIDKERVGLDELRWVGIGEIVTAAVIHILVVNDVLVGAFLLIGVAVVPSINDIVNKVAILGIVGRHLAPVASTQIEAVFVARVIHHPNVRDHEHINTASPIFIDNVIGNQDRRGVGCAEIGAVIAHVHDDAVAVRMV